MPNPYAHDQLARALVTANEHEDAATRSRADSRVRAWLTVLQGLANGCLAVGSRTPVRGLPAWVTLEVVRGGFATGRASASGPLEADELERIDRLGLPRSREALFASYLTDTGVAELLDLVDSRAYEVRLPEDGALLTVAALARLGRRAEALEVLETLRPYAGSLRFMPRVTEPSTQPADHVHRRTVSEVRSSLEQMAPSSRIETQREALSVWLPLTDRFVSFWSASSAVDGAWGGAQMAEAWSLLTAYDSALRDHPRCRKYRNPKENLPILVAATRAAVDGDLDDAWRRRVRHVLSCVRGKREAAAVEELRRVQAQVAARPAHHRLGGIAAARLAEARADEGLTDLTPVVAAVTRAEEEATGVPEWTPMPPSVGRKVRLARSAPVEVLVREGLVPSSEVLAELVPALTARQVAASVDDPGLGAVLGATYAAFRRRRTLLLLDLEKQVQFTELPWVAAAMDASGGPANPDNPAGVAREVAALAIDSFPGTILPNPLISELSTLYAAAGLDVPLTEELAADIFMGRFSPKFTRAAKVAAEWLRGSLYERYYGVSFADVLALPEREPAENESRGWLFGRRRPARPIVSLGDLCWRGVPDGNRWSVARNGMIIERQQILTTHNLAVLLRAGSVTPGRPACDLARDAAAHAAALLDLAQRQARPLATVKDAAYAWRQAVFFLSLVPAADRGGWVEESRLLPLASQWPMSEVIDGLSRVLADEDGAGVRPFLGWTVGPHWALARRPLSSEP